MTNRPHKIFTYISDEKLCSIIEQAGKQAIYAAPSLSIKVAQALCSFIENNEKVVLRIIIDADAEAFRLGFGEYEGLKLLIERRVDIRCAKGLRIAVLIADATAWIFAPTPEIIFEQPTEAINNAIQVSVEFAEQILFSVAPDILFGFTDAKAEEEGVAIALTSEIGAEPIKPADLYKIEEELKENPAQKFDAARKVRVYQSYFQFVELSLSGCRLASHTINIPTSLLNIAQDSDLQNRVRSTCRLLDNTSDFSRKVKVLEGKVKLLRKNYIESLGKRYGSVLLRNKREEFDKEVAALRAELKTFSETIKEEIQKEIASSREKLIEMLLPGLMNNPPTKLTSRLAKSLDKDTARLFIGKELDRQFPEPDDLIDEMQLYCDFKDVTYEMLHDDNFIKAIKTKYEYIDFDKLYSEQQTIAQRTDTT